MNQSAGCASFAATSNPGQSTRDECASSLGSKPPKSSTRCSNTAPLVRPAPPTALVLRRWARTGSTTPPGTRAACPEPTDRRGPPALAPRSPPPPGSPPFSPHSGTLQASTPTAPPPTGSRPIERTERTRSEHRVSTTIFCRHRRSAGYSSYPPMRMVGSPRCGVVIGKVALADAVIDVGAADAPHQLLEEEELHYRFLSAARGLQPGEHLQSVHHVAQAGSGFSARSTSTRHMRQLAAT